MKERWPEMKGHVHRWVLEEPAAGRGLLNVQLRLHTMAVAKEMNLIDFAGRPSWCYYFMERNHLSIRAWTSVCQKWPEDFQFKVNSFHELVRKQLVEHNMSPDNIINTDEVPLTFDILMGLSVAQKG